MIRYTDGYRPGCPAGVRCRLDPEREARCLIAKLEALGHHVTLDAVA